MRAGIHSHPPEASGFCPAERNLESAAGMQSEALWVIDEERWGLEGAGGCCRRRRLGWCLHPTPEEEQRGSEAFMRVDRKRPVCGLLRPLVARTRTRDYFGDLKLRLK